MSFVGGLQLGIVTLVFMLAASAAKAWTIAPSLPRILLVLALYSAGNLIMLRLIREFGLGVAISLSGVIQLVAVNVIAFAWYGERLGTVQSIGVVLAVVAVTLVTLGPYIDGT
jgi:multidrug transporter EmrE-like cation transporter